MLDYKLIDALAKVVKEGSFEKGARALFITQSAVSQRIKLLEEQMGQILIVRSSPPQVTDAGRQLLKHYLQVKQLEDDLMQKVGEGESDHFTTLAVGINADSLALWLLDAIYPFLDKEKVLLDIRVDDQEQTHRLLKNGEVMGCISSEDKPMQGCIIEYLGQVKYRMMASPKFASDYFVDGITFESAANAPAIMFDHNDDLHYKFFRKAFGKDVHSLPTHYLASVEKYAEYIARGHAYGMIPDQQSEHYLESGELLDLLPGCFVEVDLYWHCWSLKSDLLTSFTKQLTSNAKKLLRHSF